MFATIKGLVLRETRYKEADRILTVLTEDRGKLTLKARGALRKGSRLGAASQTLCYSEFTLFGNRGRWTADEGSTLEQFLGLRGDIGSLALGTYFAELLDTVCAEEMPDGPALQLALNALYALSRGMYGPEHIKSVFELRLLSLEGFEPETAVCGVCGRPDIREPMFSPGSGVVHCRECGILAEGESVTLDAGALDAMRHIIGAEPRREFSFAVPEESERRLAAAAESFVRRQLDRSFSTLDYWKSVN
ncbi:MAG: DNA repair protein RecO [Oscillospiraceae bacterium]|nr:DNA repair protein RecO [Oscillospiraceae bacterium]